ncbi:MAG: nucleoside hydrolase, partial [Pirellulaceae bacterium]|nr:nucleoside hydrolase [Pirellulaceae bacterium]
ILEDYNYVKHHPLPEAYTLYNPPPHDRPTWDLTSVLQAVEPGREYFQLSTTGTVTVEEDGFTRFEKDTDGNRRYLVLSPAGIDRLTEALVQLCSQPPG